MNHRTYGETNNCKGCRFWSEMLAESNETGITAYCLSGGINMGKYMRGSQNCGDWRSGHLGAIDEPGDDPMKYEKENK